jgi:hypothetical protein
MSVDNLAIAGFAVLPILVWIVKTLKEALNIDGKYLPPVTLAVALVLVAVALFAPKEVAALVGTSLAVAVAANMSVRYAKAPTDK